MSHSTETLYLIVTPTLRGRWHRKLRIRSVTKHRPTPKIGEAMVRINVHLPDDVLTPPVVNVEIKPEHIAAPAVKVEATPA